MLSLLLIAPLLQETPPAPPKEAPPVKETPPTQETSAPPQTQPIAPKKIDGVAAIVNNEVITESALAARIEPAKKSFGFKDPAEWDRFVRDTLANMVKEKLFSQAAQRSSLDQQRIEYELEEHMKKIEKDAGGKTALLEKLRQQTGQTYDEYKRDRRMYIEADDLRAYELGLIPGSSGRFSTETYVTPANMKEYFRIHEKDFVVTEATRARQIFLFADDEVTLEAAKVKGATLIERLNKGEDFAKLAEEASDWKPKEGGDMGWVPREKSAFDSRITSFLFSKPAGTVSEPIELATGIAIVKIEERRERKVRSFEECQNEIAWKIIRERRDERSLVLQDKLLRDSYVWPPDILRR